MDVEGDDPGQVLPEVEGFRFIERIGRGASADVYRVSKGPLSGQFALKLWRVPASADLMRKFDDECRLQFELSDHPNVVRLHWCGTEPGQRPWLVTELFDESLEERLARGPSLSAEEVVQIVDDVLAGLQVVHDHGNLHRDVKPANVLLKRGRAAITDLGLAMRVGAETSATAAGTHPYAAPELGRGASPSTRSDVYSVATTIVRILGDEIPAAVEPILDRAQSQVPDDRPVDAGRLRHDLVPVLAQSRGVLLEPPDDKRSGRVASRPVRATRRRSGRRSLVAVGAVVVVAGGSTAAALPSWNWGTPDAASSSDRDGSLASNVDRSGAAKTEPSTSRSAAPTSRTLTTHAAAPGLSISGSNAVQPAPPSPVSSQPEAPSSAVPGGAVNGGGAVPRTTTAEAELPAPCAQKLVLTAAQAVAGDQTVMITVSRRCPVPRGDVLELIMELKATDCTMSDNSQVTDDFYYAKDTLGDSSKVYHLQTPSSTRVAYVIQVSQQSLAAFEHDHPVACVPAGSGGPNGWRGDDALNFFNSSDNPTSNRLSVITA